MFPAQVQLGIHTGFLSFQPIRASFDALWSERTSPPYRSAESIQRPRYFVLVLYKVLVPHLEGSSGLGLDLITPFSLPPFRNLPVTVALQTPLGICALTVAVNLPALIFAGFEVWGGVQASPARICSE